MTARGDLDLVLSEWMAATAHVVEPEGLHDDVMARVPAIRQRAGWLAGRSARGFGQARRSSAQGLSRLAAAAAITVAGLVWSLMPGAVVPNPSASPPGVVPPSQFPSPTMSAPSTVAPPSPGLERAEVFFPPFDYAVPDGSGLIAVGGDEHNHVIRWVVGAERGITVASGQEAWGHGTTSRYAMGGTPANVIKRLQNQGGLDLKQLSTVELDGMPALAVTVEDSEATDIHVGTESIPYVNFFQLNQPSRLIVSGVDGNVVFVTIWARTAEDRDAFMPTAMEFVDSIDFIGLPGPSPDLTTGQTGPFVVPFDFAVPTRSGLKPAADGPLQHRVAWVVGQESQPQDARYGGQTPGSGVDRGIVIGASERPWAHGSDGRYFLRTTPEGVFDDLAGPSGVDLTDITPVALGDRSGLAASIADHAAGDIHLSGGLEGLVGPTPDAVGLTDPNRLIVANVDGKVMFVVIWARTAEGLEAFLPTAMEFVDSIHFVGGP